jgi:hypothetical protein
MTEHRAPYLVKEPDTHKPLPYQAVRYPDGSLAFRYDPKRGMVEIQRRGQRFYFDLTIIIAETIDNST